MLQRNPQNIDEYVMIRPIGGSARFTVYQAADPNGNHVALKVALNRSAPDLAHLRREREIVEYLGIANLRQVRHVGQSENGYVYAVMEWGEISLRDLMDEKQRFSREEVIRYLTPVAEALDEMHARQYIHCNVTPEHILIKAEGRILLAGLAQARRRGQHPGPGDPRYSSAERNNNQPVGAWCDMYSLGAIAWEMITGEPPFAGRSPEDMQRAHAVLTPEMPRPIRRSLGRDATRALMRALAKEPADRFHTGTAFIEALKEQQPASMRFRQGLVDFGHFVLRAVRRTPRFAKLTSLLLIVLAVGAGLVYSGAQRDEVIEEDPRTATAAFVAQLETPVTIWTPKALSSPSSPTPVTAAALETREAATSAARTPTVTATGATAAPTELAPEPTATPQPAQKPETLHAAPVLLEPADVTRFPADSGVDLKWQYDGQLQPGEAFDIRMWKPGEPAWGIARSTSTEYHLQGPPKGAGEYSWLVVVVRDDPQTGDVIETSKRSSTRRVFWG